MVAVVDRAPETLPAAFAVGDTVTGEDIATAADLDEFALAAQAGQQIGAVAEALGAPDSGVLLMSVDDPVGGVGLGGAYASPGASVLVTTGRMSVPATRTYRFLFYPYAFYGPRYRGAYRFWTYLIDPRPEHLAATAPTGTVVTGERIDRAGDADEIHALRACGR
jgi:hypothetical protein